MYVGIVPGIPGAHTQAKTLDELQKKLKEVVELCLEKMTPRRRKQLQRVCLPMVLTARSTRSVSC